MNAIKASYIEDDFCKKGIALMEPGPIVTADSFEEYLVDQIIDIQYDHQHTWVATTSELSNCEALDLT